MSTISEEVIEKLTLNSSISRPTGLQYNSHSQTLYVYGTGGIQLLNLYEESKNVWKIYVDYQKFSKAYEICKSLESEELSQVCLLVCCFYVFIQVAGLYAEQLFQRGSYREAAKKFAESNLTFEEVVLKLVSKANEAGLNIFVEEWLKKLAPEETT